MNIYVLLLITGFAMLVVIDIAVLLYLLPLYRFYKFCKKMYLADIK